MGRKVYLDSAATTYVSSEVMAEMLPCFNAIYGNSNSVHSYGRDALAIVDRARDRIAHAINAEKANEIYFTSGGTEADNWAIKGLAYANKDKGKHIITSVIEHHAVLDACKELENEGYEVTYVPVDKTGLVNIAEIIHAIRKDTTVISIMAVNNEVGTIQNIKTIAKLAHDYGIIFHTDAVQAMGAIKLDVKDMEIDAMTISGHKIYGPKGVGCLYVKNGIKIQNLVVGGSQERGKRGGTLNVPAIAGFGKAAEIAVRDMSINQQKIRAEREYFLKNLKEKVPYIQINGHPFQKINGIANISFEMVDKESLLMLLDMEGVAVSTGSACTSNVVEESYVLKAMNVESEFLNSAIRFSFGKNISKSDIDYVVEAIVKSVEKLRSFSALTKAGRR
ncbi:MAG: cysteine desulfurase [Clostridiales bacterium]|nr:cysteine desulfurase [Clostridiales bacterium]